MSKLALVAVLVMSMALVPLLAASNHPKGEHPTKHPNRNNGKDQQGKDGRSLLAHLRPQPQDPNSAHALGHNHAPDGDDRAPQGGYVPKRAKNTREQREGEEDNDKPYHREDTSQGPGHRDGRNCRGCNHDGSYGSERVVYTGRNQRNRVKPGSNGKPARNGRNGPKYEREQRGQDGKKGLPAAQGTTATGAAEPAPAKPVPVAATPVTTQPAKSEPTVAAPTTPVPAKTSEPATAALVTPAPAKASEPATAAPVTPAPAQPVDASAPRSLLAVNHDGHDRDDHFGGGRTELVRHGDHFDKVPVGGSSPWGTELIRHGDHFDRVPVFDTTRANPWDSIGHLIGGIGNSISNGRRWLLASKDVVKTPMGSLKAKDPLAAAKSALKGKAPLSKTPLGGLKLKNPLAAPKKAVHNAMHKAADNVSKAAHELPKAAANLPKEFNKLPKAVGMPRSLLAANTEIIVVNPGHHHHRRVRCGLLWCWN